LGFAVSAWEDKVVARKAEELRPVMVRVPEGVRRQLAREAKKNGRSMNTEIIHRLTQSLVSESLAELYRQHAETAAEVAAAKAADEVIKRLRSEHADDQRNSKSLLGNVGRRTIAEGLSPPPADLETEQEEGQLS
jgi:Arc-like DNA binding domain